MKYVIINEVYYHQWSTLSSINSDYVVHTLSWMNSVHTLSSMNSVHTLSSMNYIILNEVYYLEWDASS
jgi:hypothetical protein